MSHGPATRDPTGLLGRFRRRFWQPPRAHGEVIEDRTVSFLELFYDLVYVVVIARAAHTLAEDISWRSVAEFAVVFGLIWLAWLNGTVYHDLHGRDDGRSRAFIFVQMLVLALLAVFTADAAGASGTQFGLVYGAFLVVLTWLWYSVRRRDAAEYRVLTGRYLAGMMASIPIVGGSAFLPDGPRLIVWALFVAAWIAGGFLLGVTAGPGRDGGFVVTDSMVERFGLFTIIVLGEVVVGVVTGLSELEPDFRVVATGLIGLVVGFGIWWTYFDYVGRRLPRPGGSARSLWALSHLPLAAGIAASGAAMVSLVAHAGDDRAPAPTAWLLTGSVALGLVALVGIMMSLRDFVRLSAIYRPLVPVVLGGAAAALGAGWWRPVPWLLATLVVTVLSVLWWFAVFRLLRLEDPAP